MIKLSYWAFSPNAIKARPLKIRNFSLSLSVDIFSTCDMHFSVAAKRTILE